MTQTTHHPDGMTVSKGVYRRNGSYIVRFTRRENGKPKAIHLGAFKELKDAEKHAQEWLRNNPLKPPGKPWSKEHRQVLTDNAGKLKPEEIAALIDKSANSVRYYAKLNKISLKKR